MDDHKAQGNGIPLSHLYRKSAEAMKHYIQPSDQRCDGSIPNDSGTEPCQRRETCQRYIAHRSDFDKRMVAWMIPVRNCVMYIQGKP